ncbi:putative nucleotide-binding protein containing TIR-like domain [Paraburkholderia ribeironis]|uniref:Putative nucleotide-binding protein containing TIR-like domain n=1 Tax=Paraburkholderia ribeironis TaxID=1247936 RepID=A0A1N7S4L6_9BURK|nr:nucleotide-binding protein [Paraburkholderia ribeironis]SIT42238.1 putative nucleotide-binding protein containing TIR-like domain [Paraburkholderia ribeironis]
MATKRAKAAVKEPSEPAKLRMSIEQAAQKLDARIEACEPLAAEAINSVQSLEQSQERYRAWHDFNVEMLRRMFTNEEEADKYRSTFYGAMFLSIGGGRDVGKEIRDHKEEINTKLARLKALKGRLELFEIEGEAVADLPREMSAVPPTSATEGSDKVFIVHGHNEAGKLAVARLLETLKLKPVILSEEPNEGRTIIEKFEHNAGVGFAIVLMTADDVGGKTDQQLKPRARQNVILELGYFVGKLGRPRVCALYESGVEMPSDIIGVGYVSLDPAGHWRFALAKELRAAGYPVNMNDL